MRAHASPSARPSALNAASATWWSSAPRRLDVEVQRACIANRSSACGSRRQREAADAVAGERERDLRVRALDEVDRREAARLVHRDRGRAVADESFPSGEGGLECVAERGHHVLDRVVLVHLDVAAREELEVELPVEGEEREQVVEEADAGVDARAAAAVEAERDAQRGLGRRADDERGASPGGGRLDAERARAGGRSPRADAP